MYDDTAIIQAIHRVEQAIENKWSTVQWIGALAVVIYLVSLPGKIWHAKWRYALDYGVDSKNVTIQSPPHDCAFLAAPVGEKYCHYERHVSTVHWGTSTTGDPIISYDNGKTWSTFTPEPNTVVPKYDTVKEVIISWNKVEDED